MTVSDRSSSADAGRGADEQARRAAARAERLRAQLASAERQERAWSAGSEGERLVAQTIKAACWPALHDQPWPGRARANIDHLALSPQHIWVVDAKHWSGDVLVRNGVLRQNGYRRTDNLTKACTAAADVAAALGPGAPAVEPMICLTQAGRSLPACHLDGVVVVGLDHLATALGRAPEEYEAMPALLSQVTAALSASGAPAETTAGQAPVRVPRPAQVSPPASGKGRHRTAAEASPPLRGWPSISYATWQQRVAATSVDWAILLLPLFVAYAFFQLSEAANIAAGWVWLALAAGFGWLNGTKGRTPGKALVGLKLVRDRDGGTIGGPRGLMRALALPLMAIVSGGLIWVVALLWPRWDVKKQALHDKLVGASVIESPLSQGFTAS